jgi:dipeptidyl aminopeptidase/acylaminoacyl peptidase
VPGLAFAYTIPDSGKPAGTPRQVTFADTQGIDLASLSEPQLIKYKSFDGLEIPAFMYLPKDWKPGKPVPFVVDYHGGPEGQHRPGFDREAQYLISEGFGLLLPNVRGSSGYGRNFLMMDDYKKRWDSVKDGVYAAQWLVDQGYATPGKISSYGGSYGGFMAVATLVEDTERVERGEATQRLFGAGCKVVGIVNFQTFLQNTAGYRRKLREAEYGPLSDPEFLDSVSPLLRANKINAPMMLAHGLNDPRVPVGEAMQLAEALQRRGYDPEQVYFHDEGHGFAKLENRLLFQKRLSRFLKKNIGQ